MNYFCPNCSVRLSVPKNDKDVLTCKDCNQKYNSLNGYFIFDSSQMVSTKDYNLDISVLDIENQQLINRLDRWLFNQLDSIDGKKILSIGCGGGRDIMHLNKLGAEAYGMDFKYRTTYWSDKGYSNKSFFVSSMDFIPFPNDYFDIILCFGVIEHVYEDLYFSNNFQMLNKKRNDFLKSIYQILKSDGKLILTSPNRNFPLDFQHNYPSLKLYKKWGNRTLMNKWRSIKGKYLSLHLHSPFNKSLTVIER